MTENGKMEVLYLNCIWISSTFINSSTFVGYKSEHPFERIIISRDGKGISVPLRDLEIVPDKKQKRIALHV